MARFLAAILLATTQTSAILAMMGAVPAWTQRTIHQSANEAHHRPFPPTELATVTIIEPPDATLVLGSRQNPTLLNSERAASQQVAVANRRSGGGLVYLHPCWQLWIDVEVPRSSPLWHDDVGKAFGWLGETWAATLSATLDDHHSVSVHHGRFFPGQNGALVCFSSLGPGEVLVDGTKVVGISQRRTRDWIRLQSTLNLRWDPDAIADNLSAEARRHLHPPLLPFQVGPAHEPVDLVDLLSAGEASTGEPRHDATPLRGTIIQQFLRTLPNP